MGREIHIFSYFSLPTDLAGEMKDWPEFVCGEGYTADLINKATSEAVSVKLITAEDEHPYLSVSGSGKGVLFDRVLGRVVYALSRHTDNLMVNRKA